MKQDLSQKCSAWMYIYILKIYSPKNVTMNKCNSNKPRKFDVLVHL